MKRYREMDNFRDSYLAEGEVIGMQKGEVIGLEKERKRAVNTMYSRCISVENIGIFLNLPIEEIKRLLEDTE